jgi:oxygen-independent coproporphyrinogen-3 oxidase
MRLPVYIHVPFCRSKCPYCAFVSTPIAGEPGLPYMAALLAEASARLAALGVLGGSGDLGDLGALGVLGGSNDLAAKVVIPSVYFGGGTPSLLSPDQVSHILAAISQRASLAPGAEITLEANPGTIDRERAEGYRQAGVTRISIGCQSFDDGLLAKLGRIHSGREGVRAYGDVRAAGFDNVSLDLMFGVPGQTLAAWRWTLRQALDLAPEHISLYCLTIEPGTLFAQRDDQGNLFPSQSRDQREDREADMFELAMDLLPAAGYEHYEIANFALPGRRCAHNLAYWRNEPYIGLGPAAHSYLPTATPPLGERSANVSDIEGYVALARRRGVVTASRERLSAAKSVGESVMLGLRLIEGVDLAAIAGRWGLDPGAQFAAEIAHLASKGLIEQKGSVIQLTRRSILLADEVMQFFV